MSEYVETFRPFLKQRWWCPDLKEPIRLRNGFYSTSATIIVVVGAWPRTHHVIEMPTVRACYRELVTRRRRVVAVNVAEKLRNLR